MCRWRTRATKRKCQGASAEEEGARNGHKDAGIHADVACDLAAAVCAEDLELANDCWGRGCYCWRIYSLRIFGSLQFVQQLGKMEMRG